MIKVGITGGIGSGKTTLCRILEEFGVAVYYSDDRAKALMGNSETLRRELVAEFGDEVYQDGRLNRLWLAERVFRNPERLAALNAIVHPAVMADFDRWAEEQCGPYVVLESAILFSAGLAERVDCTVAVLAPLPLRVERATSRDGADAEAVKRRIAAQMSDDELAARADYTLVNIRLEELREEAESLHKRLCHVPQKA